MTTTMSFTTRIIKNLGTNSMSIGLSSIIYMLSAVCFAKMASSDVYMKLGVRTCITVTFLTTALYCVLVPQCSSVLYDLCFTNFTRYGNRNLIFISNK